jgi:hypothetical protein
MEILILAIILLAAMATVDLPDNRKPKLRPVPVKVSKKRRGRSINR